MRPAVLFVTIAMTVQILAVGVARANVKEEDEKAELYRCGKPKGRFSVTMKDEVALKDLLAWAMGFSCKKFIYSSSLAQRSAKLTMITPGTLDAGESWALFEVGLEAMGLAAVPKGGVLEIEES